MLFNVPVPFSGRLISCCDRKSSKYGQSLSGMKGNIPVEGKDFSFQLLHDSFKPGILFVGHRQTV